MDMYMEQDARDDEYGVPDSVCTVRADLAEPTAATRRAARALAAL